MSRHAKIFRFPLSRIEADLAASMYIFACKERFPTDREVRSFGGVVQRAYTSLSKRDAKGFMDLLTKYVSISNSRGVELLTDDDKNPLSKR